jgi:hypothetical protein
MEQHHGVRLGQHVRDLDGTPLGRVKRLTAWGIEISKGFPILFRKDLVARYDEVRGVRDGELILARSSRDLLDLAMGELPPSWRIPAPHEFPIAATPAEARGVMEELAGGGIAGGAVPPPLPRESEYPEERADDVRADRAYGRTGGEPAPPPPHP